MRGITGPAEVFEGNKGFMDIISGPFAIDWSKEGSFDRINKTVIKKYNAEVHSQSAIEGALELKHEHGFSAADIDRIEIDIFETMGRYVDILKFAGGSFSLMPQRAVQELIALCHRYDVMVSTGGFIEHVLVFGKEAVEQYIEECKQLEFDIIEISSGFITVPMDDLVRLTERVKAAGLKPKPEVGIQFGAGGASGVEQLEAEGLGDPDWAVALAKKHLEAGAYMIMIESEGITEDVREWRTDVAAKFIREQVSKM